MNSVQEGRKEEFLFLDSLDGYIEKLKDFLENGGDPNVTDIHGNTLLHMASKYKQAKIVWMLMRRNVKLDIQNNIGDTALHIACKKGCMSVAEELYRKGTKTKILNNEGKTAFFYLTAKQRKDMTEFSSKLYCTGKYEMKVKPETPHVFGMSDKGEKACTRMN
jgi:ankyrin repeat protein